MSENVHVQYADDAAGFARKLLDAAGELDLPLGVVEFSPDGHYSVPEEVAEKASVSYEVQDGTDPVTVEVPEDPITNQDPPASIADDPKTPVDPGAEPDSEGKLDSEEEPELPIGKALEDALESAGLSKSGNKAEKQARLAEHLNKE
jgi:hypothetical protein